MTQPNRTEHAETPKPTADDFKRRVLEAFEPVKDWYDGDGERDDLVAMITDAVEDLQHDRKSVLSAEEKLRRISSEIRGLLFIFRNHTLTPIGQQRIIECLEKIHAIATGKGE